MKLDKGIRRVSGHCCKDFLGQCINVKVIARPVNRLPPETIDLVIKINGGYAPSASPEFKKIVCCVEGVRMGRGKGFPSLTD